MGGGETKERPKGRERNDYNSSALASPPSVPLMVIPLVARTPGSQGCRRGGYPGPGHLGQGSANFFYEGPNSN